MVRAIIFDCYGVLVDDALRTNSQLFTYIRDRLKPHYKLGILSNIDAHSIERLLSPEQLALFDATALSFQTGLLKPDPQAYHYISDVLRADPTECVFIDDINRFCIAAHHEGMQTICYTSFSLLEKELEQILMTS